MSPNAIRYFLGSLLLFVSLNALGGGYYGIIGAKELPQEWLQDSPFDSYFIPGLFLLAVIGGAFMIGAVAVFRQSAYARRAAMVCGVLLALWIATQVAIIGYVSWLQPAMAIIAVVVLTLARMVPGKV